MHEVIVYFFFIKEKKKTLRSHLGRFLTKSFVQIYVFKCVTSAATAGCYRASDACYTM